MFYQITSLLLEVVAGLLPAGSSAKRSVAVAVARMRQFILDAPKTQPADIRALLDDGRD